MHNLHFLQIDKLIKIVKFLSSPLNVSLAFLLTNKNNKYDTIKMFVVR